MYLDCFSERRVSFAPSCQISAAKLQAGIYAVLMGMYASVTQRRAAVEVGHGVVVESRALLLDFQLVP